jgi:hypothetical protein
MTDLQQRIPFLLRYEEEPEGDSVIDGLDDDYYYEPDNGGMAVRRRFTPWESCATLKSAEG